MRGPVGGFYSALDADSEGEEGRFYVWTPEEIRAVLGDETGAILDYYGVSEGGNFEGRNILHLAGGTDAAAPEGLDEMRRALYGARAKRVWPGLDDKRLTAWNALMVAALAEAGAVLGREDYLEAAGACAEGALLRTYKDGRAHLKAYLEDHAFLLEALLTLYEASFETVWFARARELAETLLSRFADGERGGFFSTADDHESLIARRKEIGDHPIPSGNSAAAFGLLRFSVLTGERAYESAAEGVFRLFSDSAGKHPEAFAHLLRAIDFQLSPIKEVALVGEDLTELAATVRAEHRPHLVLAGGPAGSETPALLANRSTVDGRSTAYVCESFSCRQPVTDPVALRKMMD
jgi:uncharacterized protein YyaL (SSP411 family)